jgi:hypothetical protein
VVVVNTFGCDWRDLTEDQKSQVIELILDRLGLFISVSDHDSAVNLFQKPFEVEARSIDDVPE